MRLTMIQPGAVALAALLAGCAFAPPPPPPAYADVPCPAAPPVAPPGAPPPDAAPAPTDAAPPGPPAPAANCVAAVGGYAYGYPVYDPYYWGYPYPYYYPPVGMVGFGHRFR
ncbi:MAG TPA: hypothetical protein VLX85_05530 [Stellaceae bacterium]|nr:hypothetical protein [Stellaceae bacterium]